LQLCRSELARMGGRLGTPSCAMRSGLNALQVSSWRRDVPAFGNELIYRALLDPFLHTKFVIQEMVGKRLGVGIHVIDADAIAISIGADQADSKILGGGFGDICFSSLWHRVIG